MIVIMQCHLALQRENVKGVLEVDREGRPRVHLRRGIQTDLEKLCALGGLTAPAILEIDEMVPVGVEDEEIRMGIDGVNTAGRVPTQFKDISDRVEVGLLQKLSVPALPESSARWPTYEGRVTHLDTMKW